MVVVSSILRTFRRGDLRHNREPPRREPYVCASQPPYGNPQFCGLHEKIGLGLDA